LCPHLVLAPAATRQAPSRRTSPRAGQRGNRAGCELQQPRERQPVPPRGLGGRLLRGLPRRHPGPPRGSGPPACFVRERQAGWYSGRCFRGTRQVGRLRRGVLDSGWQTDVGELTDWCRASNILASPRLTTGEAQLLRPHPLPSQAFQRVCGGMARGRAAEARSARAIAGRYLRAAAARALCRAGAVRARAQCNVWVFCDGAAGCGACSDATFGYRGQTGNNARFGPGGACTRDNKFPRCARRFPGICGGWAAHVACWVLSRMPAPVLKIEVVAYHQHPWAHACAWGGGGCKRAARAAVSAGVLGWARMRQGPPPQRVFPWGTWARRGCALVAAEWRSQQLAERAAAGGPSQSRWVQRLRRHV